MSRNEDEKKGRLSPFIRSGVMAAMVVVMISPFIFPTTVHIEVVAMDSEEVEVSGWVEESQDLDAEPFNARWTPFELTLRAKEVRAGFETVPEGKKVTVTARARRGWFPGPRVEVVGSHIEIRGSLAQMGSTSR